MPYQGAEQRSRGRHVGPADIDRRTIRHPAGSTGAVAAGASAKASAPGEARASATEAPARSTHLNQPVVDSTRAIRAPLDP